MSLKNIFFLLVYLISIMQKEIDFYPEMASEHRLQEYSKGLVPLYLCEDDISCLLVSDN